MADKIFAGLQLPNLENAVAREADAGLLEFSSMRVNYIAVTIKGKSSN